MIFSKHIPYFALALSGSLFVAQAAIAQDGFLPGLLSADGELDDPNPDLIVSVRGGASYAPSYFGADHYDVDPSGSFRIDFVRLPIALTFGSSAAVGFNQGFGLLGSANYISKRNSSEYSEIRGLDDVDATMELGFGLGYEQENYRVFAKARYGFLGHKAIVGDVGADLIARPIQGLTLTIGPRVDFGQDKYADTYFGVSQSESAASGLKAYTADGGIISAGLEMTALYQFNPLWGVRAKFTWDRLTNDAGNSPIAKQGDDDQYRINLQLVRRISIKF